MTFDAVEVNSASAGEEPLSFSAEYEDPTAAIVSAVFALDDLSGFELVDEAGDTAAADPSHISKIGWADAVWPCLIEHEEDLVVLEFESFSVSEFLGERISHGSKRLEYGSPCR